VATERPATERPATERPATERHWILAETFRGTGYEPTVLAIGQEPRDMKPLKVVVRGGGYLPEVRAMILEVADTGSPVDRYSRDGRRRLIGVPLAAVGDRVHAVYAWYGPRGEEPPRERPAAGAWHFNLAKGTTNRSADLFKLYGTPEEEWQHVGYIAEAFWPRLEPGPDELGALAMLVHARPGMKYHGRGWTVKRRSAENLRVNLWCRAMEEPGASGQPEVIVRGITQAIGPAAAAPGGPQPIVTLEQRVVAAAFRPGYYRAIVNFETLTLVRWLDRPMPGIAWELGGGHKPAIHRRDLRRAKGMPAHLADPDGVQEVLRLRTTAGDWRAVRVDAKLMLTDPYTPAALVTLSDPPGEQG
jgi:hypothetical protein